MIVTRINSGIRGCYTGAFLAEGIPKAHQFQEYTEKAGKAPAITMWFHAFRVGFEFPREACETVHNLGSVPFIKLEPWSWDGATDDSFSLDKIIAGQFDEEITAFARGVVDWGQEIFLAFGHEMNSPTSNLWYPWQGHPEKYISAYRKVCELFHKVEAANVKWVFNVNEWDPSLIRAYYPGKDVVDWLAVDGFNFGNTQDWSIWKPFQEIFRPPYEQLLSLPGNKPIMIGETASTEQGGKKEQWIANAFQTIKAFPQIKAFIWFNINKETNWRIDSCEDSLAAFKTAMENPYFIGAQP